VILRRELPADHDAVHAVHRAAFGPPGGGAGRPAEVAEARLVSELHADGSVIPGLSLVATAGDEIVGHVVCSRGGIDGRPAAGLGPLGVLPAHQRRGVGLALVHGVLAAADALNEPAILLLGNPGYYRRFGFRPAQALGVAPPDPEWGEHFQIRPLTAWDGTLRGTFSYAPAFDRL
jgi:putative acetyltransferase